MNVASKPIPPKHMVVSGNKPSERRGGAQVWLIWGRAQQRLGDPAKWAEGGGMKGHGGAPGGSCLSDQLTSLL